MKVFVIILLLMMCVKGDVQINVQEQCLQENGAVTLICTVNPLSASVQWFIGADRKATCSSASNNSCVYPGGTKDSRHTFSSDVTNGQFTFKIDPVNTTSDVGDYQCVHGGESNIVSLAICETTTSTTTTAATTSTTTTTTSTTATTTTTTTTTPTTPTTFPTTTPTTASSTTSSTMPTSTPASTTQPTTATTPVSTTLTSTTLLSTPSSTTSGGGSGSDDQTVVMIVVISCVGGVFILAIVVTIFIFTQWGRFGTKSLKQHRHKGSHSVGHPKRKSHSNRNGQNISHVYSDDSSYYPQSGVHGYMFYNGRYAKHNPIFEESGYVGTGNPAFVSYGDGFHHPGYDDLPPEYSHNWN